MAFPVFPSDLQGKICFSSGNSATSVFFFKNRNRVCFYLGKVQTFKSWLPHVVHFCTASIHANALRRKQTPKTRTHFSQYLYNSRLVCQIFYKLHTYIHTLSMAIGRPGPVQDLPDASDKERWFLVVVQKPNCCQSHSSIFQSRLRFSTWGRQPQTSLDVDRSVCF